jgi:hypothetical protein
MRRRGWPLAILLPMIGKIIGRRALAPTLTLVKPSGNGPRRSEPRGGRLNIQPVRSVRAREGRQAVPSTI